MRSEILVAVDNLNFRRALCNLLAKDGYTVCEADNGLMALRLWQQRDPQLMIVETTLSDLDGFQVLTHLRQTGDTPVILLAGKSAEEERARALELGATDYLSAPLEQRELTEHVKAVLDRTPAAPGEKPETPRVVGKMRINAAINQVLVDDRSVNLSRTEFKLLAELAVAPDRVLTDKQLLTRVWGVENRDSDPVMLRVTISRLRRKIEPNARQPRYILRQHGVGYRLTSTGAD